jgi:cysteine desulfurase
MKIFSPKIIYLDYAAATPLHTKAVHAMHDYEKTHFGNPSSIHKSGLASKKVLEESRTKIAKLLRAHSDEIIFTGSGTESDALAIFGVVNNFALNSKEIPHIVTTTIEHPAVLENCKMLEQQGKATVTYIDIDENGFVNPKDIRSALTENTVLVSCMYANNEIGTIQPIMEIAKAIRHFRKEHSTSLPCFHTDACQAMNYLFTENIEKLGVDLLTFNSSKIYGPKGVGVLFKKRGIEIEPLYKGGGQEFGLRPGTENIPSIIGLTASFEEINKIKEKESKRLYEIRDYGIEKLCALQDSPIILNGSKENRLPNNINISIAGISSELLVIELDAKGIYVSSKSACKSEDDDESYVIGALRKAQGIQSNTSDGSLRISLGLHTIKQDMDSLVSALEKILEKYKKWK